MKLVYTHPNGIVVGQARSAIELAGITCVLLNEYASGAIGELAPIDAWLCNLFNLGRHLVSAGHHRNLRVSAFNDWAKAVA